MLHRSLVCMFVLITATTLAAQQPAKLPDTPIDVARLTAHVKEISSDAYEGRGPGTRAEPKVVDYLSKQLAAAGVQPGGEPDGRGGRKWTQAVTLVRSEATGPMTASVAVSGSTIALKQGDQIAIRATQLPSSRVTIKGAPLVFLGYGVNAPERRWDDFKGLDVRGKVLVVLINDPDFDADLGKRFDGKAMTYYGRWTYKFEEAARRGAAGVLIVHETAPASYGWATVKNSNTAEIMDVVRDKPADVHPQLEAWIQRDVAVDLFKRAGLNFDAEKKKAQSQAFKPVPLGNATLSLDYAVKQTKLTSSNVIGLLKGTGHPEEVVIYSAHWDHLGIGAPDARGDRIYNGARDNGTGVASVLELARVFGKAPRTDRSVAFMFVTAEEQGLLGSEYLGQHPPIPAGQIALDLNYDAIQPFGDPLDVTLTGADRTTFFPNVQATAKAFDLAIDPEAHPEAGTYYRSDHFSLARVGIPSFSIDEGTLYAGHDAAWGLAKDDDYTAHRYHTPMDNYTPDMDFTGNAKLARFGMDLGWQALTAPHTITWRPKDEFLPAREKSLSTK